MPRCKFCANSKAILCVTTGDSSLAEEILTSINKGEAVLEEELEQGDVSIKQEESGKTQRTAGSSPRKGE